MENLHTTSPITTRYHPSWGFPERPTWTDQKEQQKEGFPKENQECAGQILQQVCTFRKAGLRGMRFHVSPDHMGKKGQEESSLALHQSIGIRNKILPAFTNHIGRSLASGNPPMYSKSGRGQRRYPEKSAWCSRKTLSCFPGIKSHRNHWKSK